MAIGRVNTTSGGNGATLTVTSTGAGTVTVSNTTLNKSYSKSVTAGGSVVFKGLKTGTWAVKLSDGTHTTTKNVTITADYSVSVSYFSATISITYPAESNCVVKNSSGTTVASNSNTGTSAKTWTATVTASGTYTVTATATDGSGKTKSTTVRITASGQTPSVALTYELVLFDNGDKTSVTGGWNRSALRFKRVSGQAGGSGPTVTTNSDDSITLGGLNYGVSGSYITVNKINFTGYTKVRFIGSVSSETTAYVSNSGFAASQNLTEFLQENAAASMTFPNTISKTYDGSENFLDISNLAGSYYLLFGVYHVTKITIKKLWLE